MQLLRVALTTWSNYHYQILMMMVRRRTESGKKSWWWLMDDGITVIAVATDTENWEDGNCMLSGIQYLLVNLLTARDLGIP